MEPMEHENRQIGERQNVIMERRILLIPSVREGLFDPIQNCGRINSSGAHPRQLGNPHQMPYTLSKKFPNRISISSWEKKLELREHKNLTFLSRPEDRDYSAFNMVALLNNRRM